MISLIICSCNEKQLSDISENIRVTIGVPYEIIAIDNSQGKYGICAAYNLGAARAQFSILCFVHEDVIFETKKWGQILVQHFQNPAVGVIGVAGSPFKSNIPSTWGLDEKYSYLNLIQNFKYTEQKSVWEHYNPAPGSLSREVVLVDGVFIAVRREAWADNHFDEKHFPGFHGYDADFCLQIYQQKKYKIIVIFDLLLKHLSEGRFDAQWIAAARQVTDKWQSVLPLYSENFSFREIKFLQRKALKQLIFASVNSHVPSRVIYKDLFRYSSFKYFSSGLFFSCLFKIHSPKAYAWIKKTIKKYT